MYYIGIDTSNYTTSIAAVDDFGNFKNIRKLLPVPEGERGIRQSEGLFWHTKNIGLLFEELDIDFKSVKAVGVSVRPRNAEGSYMPVFLAGESFAHGVAHSLGAELYEFSHQDGHIMAGIFSGGFNELLSREFLSVHLSGGTTEILKSRFVGNGFENEIVGGTKDISAGQFIDRTGVYLGMKFPCGKELEQLALGTLKHKGTLKLPVCENDGYVNFSGVETKVKGLVNSGAENPGELALAVIYNVAESLTRAINSAIAKTGVNRVLAVGGVAANTLLRKAFTENICGEVCFGTAELSTDNAVGVARLAQLLRGAAPQTPRGAGKQKRGC